MKYTVNGFSQEALVSLGLDMRDAGVLRWFIDFQATGFMKRIEHDGKIFFWVLYDKVLEELPIAGNNKYTIRRIFDKYVEVGLMEKHVEKKDGSYSTFRLVEEVYSKLVSSTTEGRVNMVGGCDKNVTPGCDKNARTKNSSSILNSSSNNIPLVKREPKNEYEKVEKEYLLNYEKLYEHHKVQTDKPIVNWNKTRGMLKQLFLTVDSKIIITALKRATQDDFCLETGYSLDVILSKAVLNRLINSKNTENVEERERTCPICGSHDIGPIGCRTCHYDFCTPPDEWKKMLEE